MRGLGIPPREVPAQTFTHPLYARRTVSLPLSHTHRRPHIVTYTHAHIHTSHTHSLEDNPVTSEKAQRAVPLDDPYDGGKE